MDSFLVMALVHGSQLDPQRSPLKALSPTDRTRLGPANLGHPIQDMARKARLHGAATSTAGAKTISNDGRVPEEGVFSTRAC
jgi:hypothetical protein